MKLSTSSKSESMRVDDEDKSKSILKSNKSLTQDNDNVANSKLSHSSLRKVQWVSEHNLVNHSVNITKNKNMIQVVE